MRKYQSGCGQPGRKTTISAAALAILSFTGWKSLIPLLRKTWTLYISKFTNSIDTVKALDIPKTILLQTSPNARTVATPALISLEMVKTASDPKDFQQSNIPVGVILEGKFQSLYANRISAALSDSLARGIIISHF